MSKTQLFTTLDKEIIKTILGRNTLQVTYIYSSGYSQGMQLKLLYSENLKVISCHYFLKWSFQVVVNDFSKLQHCGWICLPTIVEEKTLGQSHTGYTRRAVQINTRLVSLYWVGSYNHWTQLIGNHPFKKKAGRIPYSRLRNHILCG